MNRTIPEIADMIGIDKGRIYRLLKKINVEPVQNEPNKVFDEPAQDLIKQHLIKKSSSRTENEPKQTQNEPKQTQNEPKQTQNEPKRTDDKNKDKIIDALIDQLKQKDKQIETLGTLVTQQQQLTLQDKKTISDQAKQIESLSVRSSSSRTENEQNRTKTNSKRTKSKMKHKFLNIFKK